MARLDLCWCYGISGSRSECGTKHSLASRRFLIDLLDLIPSPRGSNACTCCIVKLKLESTRVKGAWNAKSNMEALTEVQTKIDRAVQDLTLTKVGEGFAQQVSRTLAKAMLSQTLPGIMVPRCRLRPGSVSSIPVGHDALVCSRKGPTHSLELIWNHTVCLGQRHT